VHFGFILFLALGAVIDSHVELQRANVEVKGHEKALMEVVILRKLRSAALEILLTGTVVPNLHFIGTSFPRVLMENRFSQLSPVHELGEFYGIVCRRCRKKNRSWEKKH
jgi:hypothetical protein